MLPERVDIDANRRDFIKASLVLAGGLVLTKLDVFQWIASTASGISAPSLRRAASAAYHSTHYGFSLQYPSDLAIATFDEGNGASTITFQNIEKVQGFQIYIAPQSGALSVEAEPVTPIVLAGVPGVAFEGAHTALGPTREVRFAHGRFIYEVTTLKPLDSWLAPIIKTWQFT